MLPLGCWRASSSSGIGISMAKRSCTACARPSGVDDATVLSDVPWPSCPTALCTDSCPSTDPAESAAREIGRDAAAELGVEGPVAWPDRIPAIVADMVVAPAATSPPAVEPLWPASAFSGRHCCRSLAPCGCCRPPSLAGCASARASPGSGEPLLVCSGSCATPLQPSTRPIRSVSMVRCRCSFVFSFWSSASRMSIICRRLSSLKHVSTSCSWVIKESSENW
mmetsp:Transcript_78977/g.231845  ORF Transcript_78977/g.231845 Transcript_78977/m.231845 type:complete len:223 (-) Transcript_78977:159-827(-)